MVDAPAAPSRSISSALIASCSGAGRWRYNVATDTPIVGAISRADMPDARSFRAASIRLGVMTFLRPPKIGRAHVWTPVTNAHLVCRLLLEKKNNQQNND